MAEQKHPAVYNAPDFEELARQTYDTCTLQGWADQLRQVWNARGAADIQAADQNAEPWDVTAAIKDLDR